MITIDRQIIQKIMATDVYVCLSSDKYTKDIVEKDLDKAITQLELFEKNYSRFISDNKLANLNKHEKVTVDTETLAILKISKKYFEETKGLFDPTVYSSLIDEGYNTSKTEGFYNPDKDLNNQKDKKYYFSDIHINSLLRRIKKPIELKIDLGGIGKGYIVDKIAKTIKNKYSDFCISAGGDMYVGGVDHFNKLQYWAIEIENPLTENTEISLPTLMLSNQAVATSSIAIRHWVKNSIVKNHIINPTTGKSIENDLISVTVVGDSVTYCDVYAKTLLIMGLQDGMKYCYNNKIAAVFVLKNGSIKITKPMESYVWK